MTQRPSPTEVPDALETTTAKEPHSCTRKGAGYFLRFFRLIRLTLHLFWGLSTVTFVYPLIPDRWRLWLKRRWSGQLLTILGIRLSAHIDGLPPTAMVIANHISWIDVFVINAAFPAAFIAKAEVRRWPLIGWLCACTDTLFLQRGSPRETRTITASIQAFLRQGKRVGIFPEGTTTDGSRVLAFHAALIQPAIDAGAPIVPLSIAYLEADGQPSTAPAFVGDDTLVDSFRSIAAARGLEARLVAYPVLDDKLPRREVAQRARAAIIAGLGLSEAQALASHPVRTAPETNDDLPGALLTAALPTNSPNPALTDSA